MRKNKTPGRDGISIDFYAHFWDIIGMDMYQMISYSYQTNSLAESQKKGVLNLIPKSGKDARYLKNLRPITLLNSEL